MSLPHWSRAHGAPLFAATIRNRPEDFEVHELLDFDFSGDGEHDYLHVEKTGANTEWVTRQLASHAQVPARDVGYAGLKDRHAVTRQWLSVPRWHSPDWERLDVEGVRLLEVQRHNRKLRRGAHRQNRFRIVLRGDHGEAAGIDERLQSIAATGVPNYFGEQRFGRGGANIALADAWAAGKRLPRHKRSLAISSARSYLFNEILDERVVNRTWDKVLPGDTVNLDGTGSVFAAEQVDAALQQRCAEMDVHPAGLLWGEGAPRSGQLAEFDQWLTALSNARVKAAHRSLRLRVIDLDWSLGEDSLELRFALGRGAFATAVLRELAGITDAAGRG